MTKLAWVAALLAASLPLIRFDAVSAVAVDPRASPPSHGAKPLPKNMIIFGDSYTDNCNAWRKFSVPPNVSDAYPFPSCPPPPTGRADNGLAWPEFIANTTSINVFNFAYSAATCNNSLFSRAPDLDVTMQIDELTGNKSLSYLFTSDTLAAIFIGTNDLGFFFTQFFNPNTNDKLPPGVLLQDEAACVVAQVKRLRALGIRKFLVLQNIPLQLTSMWGSYPENGPLVAQTMANYVNANNLVQKYELDALQTTLADGTDIQIFPTYDLFWDEYHNPSRYGFTNTSSFCDQPSGACSDPENYLFWNSLHPSEHADRILAEKVVAFLQGHTDVTSTGAGQI